MYAVLLCTLVFSEELHKLPLGTSLSQSAIPTADLPSCRK